MAFLAPKEKKVYILFLAFLEFLGFLKPTPRNPFVFVKKLPKKNGNFVLALRKQLFCNAKPTLLPCKTAAFVLQNNRFCNVLITSELSNSYSSKKSLHS